MKTLNTLALILTLAPQALLARPGFNTTKVMDCIEIARAPHAIYRADVNLKTRDFGPASLQVALTTRVNPDEVVAMIDCPVIGENSIGETACETAPSLVRDGETFEVSFDGLDNIVFMDLVVSFAGGQKVHQLDCEAVDAN